MSNLSQSNLAERDKKRVLIQLVEAEDDHNVSLRNYFLDRDEFNTGATFFGIFKNCLEKVLPTITREEVSALFQENQIPGQEKANYGQLLLKLEQVRKKQKVLHDTLEQILDNFSSKDNTLFDLFEKADKDKNGYLSRKEFLTVLDDFGVYYDEDQMTDFFYFLDENRDGGISYRELNSYFTKFAKSKGKNLADLTRSSFFKGSSVI